MRSSWAASGSITGADRLPGAVRWLPCAAGVGVQDAAGSVRSQQILGARQGSEASGRYPCLRRPHRYPAGRRDRRRAHPPVRPRPSHLRPLALPAGVEAQARRPAQRRAVQGLGATTGDRAGAPPACRPCRWGSPDGRYPDRDYKRRRRRGRSGVRGSARRRPGQLRRGAQHPDPPSAAAGAAQYRHARCAAAASRAACRLCPLRQPEETVWNATRSWR